MGIGEVFKAGYDKGSWDWAAGSCSPVLSQDPETSLRVFIGGLREI
jgi:hypothetical protein